MPDLGTTRRDQDQKQDRAFVASPCEREKKHKSIYDIRKAMRVVVVENRTRAATSANHSQIPTCLLPLARLSKHCTARISCISPSTPIRKIKLEARCSHPTQSSILFRFPLARPLAAEVGLGGFLTGLDYGASNTSRPRKQIEQLFTIFRFYGPLQSV